MTLDEFLALPGAKTHDGGPCPVDGRVRVSVICRDRSITTDKAEQLWWGRTPDGMAHIYDIIAYREAP